MKKIRKTHHRGMLLPWVGALLLVLTGTVQAQLATNISIDLRALSLGNAVTADPPSISAVHYNPAGLARLDGRRVDYQFLSAIFPMESEFSAPPGFGVFGYSDDPVVCRDAPRDGNDRCSDFKKSKSSN